MRLPRRAAAAAPLIVLVLAAASCTSSATPAPSTSPGVGLSESQLQAALLTVSEVGNGLSLDPGVPLPQSFPCTDTAAPIDQQIPPRATARVSFLTTGQDFEVAERIAEYGDDTTASQALATTEKGYACSSGAIDRIPVTIGQPQDLSKNLTVAVDKIEAWPVSSPQARDSVVVAKLGTRLVTLDFGQRVGSSSTVDASAIVEKALEKLSVAAS